MGNKEWNKTGVTFIFLSVIIVVASVPLMTDYILWGRELQVSLGRIEAIRENIGRVFPVVIRPWDSLDYGYGAASLQADVYLLIPVFFRFLGMGIGTAYKLTLFLINIAVGITAYLSFRRCYRREDVALVGSMLYTWCPFRLNAMYVNGDLGESFVWIFLVMTVSSLMEFYIRDEEKKVDGNIWRRLAWGLALMAPASTSVFFVTLGMCGLCLFFQGKKALTREIVLGVCKAAGLACLVNFWFLGPMCLEWRGTLAVICSDPDRMISESIYVLRYMSTFLWGGVSSSSFENGMLDAQALCPGIAVMILIFLFLWILYVGKYQGFRVRRTGSRMLYVCLILMVLSSNVFPWDLFQSNKLFFMLIALFQVPAKWGIPACGELIAVACFVLWIISQMENEVVCQRLLLAVTLVSLATTQFFLGNVLKRGSVIRLESGKYEGIPFQIVAQQTVVWKICGIISAVTLCICLATRLMRRKNGRIS